VIACARNKGPRRGTCRYPVSHRCRWIAAVVTISAAPPRAAAVAAQAAHRGVLESKPRRRMVGPMQWLRLTPGASRPGDPSRER
jgi:hypothetical protein